MSSTFKTMLIAGTIGLSVALFAVQAAHAGGRHLRVPYVPFNDYVADTYDEEVEYYSSRRGRYAYDSDEPMTVRGIARKAMNGEIEDIIDYIAE